MAGTIAISPARRWSSAGWLFAWIVGFLAAEVTEPQLKADLREVVDENLGWLGLGDYGPDAEREMRELLAQRMVPAAESQFSSTMANRTEALHHLRQLATEAGI